MQSIRKTSMLLGIASIFVAAGSLGAAEVGPSELAGSFTLPSQVYWQRAVLPAGTYAFTMDLVDAWERITITKGTKMIGFVVLQASGDGNTHDQSSLRIVNQQVRALHLAPIGKTYYFATGKKQREMLARNINRSGVALIPVSTK
ncbi:MAG TPA: hypothetical protein VF283_00020 [Bryobacteraceae bacterium]